jgi:N-acetylglucosamine-6-phosphate deacetylase
MASRFPAEAIGLADRKGTLVAGTDADFVELDGDHQVVGCFICGNRVFEAGGS